MGAGSWGNTVLRNSSRRLITAKSLPSGLLVRSRQLRSRFFNAGSAERRDYDQHAQPALEGVVRRRKYPNILVMLGVLLASLGWMLFFSVMWYMSEMYKFLQFLDHAFPRKWHPLRLCFDLLIDDQKQQLVSEFRKKQLNGYDDSLFEFLLEFHPEILSAEGLTAEQTLRRIVHGSYLVYDHGIESQYLYRDLITSIQSRATGSNHSELLAEYLSCIHFTLLDKNGMPAYPEDADIYKNMITESYNISSQGPFPSQQTSEKPKSWSFLPGK